MAADFGGSPYPSSHPRKVTIENETNNNLQTKEPVKNTTTLIQQEDKPTNYMMPGKKETAFNSLGGEEPDMRLDTISK